MCDIGVKHIKIIQIKTWRKYVFSGLHGHSDTHTDTHTHTYKLECWNYLLFPRWLEKM